MQSHLQNFPATLSTYHFERTHQWTFVHTPLSSFQSFVVLTLHATACIIHTDIIVAVGCICTFHISSLCIFLMRTFTPRLSDSSTGNPAHSAFPFYREKRFHFTRSIFVVADRAHATVAAFSFHNFWFEQIPLQPDAKPDRCISGSSANRYGHRRSIPCIWSFKRRRGASANWTLDK